ncbi:MAG: methyltransferase type 11 [Acidobacteria bacterium RIFCSPLOWO2_02_FULL_59_13]|nr:MAG: methyltransferase type 11 [Acidobacteria bacterium RIFCSPLOWO2_02_FULL_59_13]
MTSFTSDPDRFRAFEQSGWEKAAARYHDTFRSLTTQAVDPLLDAVGAGPGVRLLDMATGPGYVAAEAARRGARVVGMDLATAMVVQARRHHPDVHFQVGDAERLPFAAKSFDAVVMSFGLLHVARPEVALSEAFRVLRSGGRVGFTVWMPPEQTVGFGMILRAIESHGNLNTPLPEGPPFFRFSDPQECCRVLREAGFIEPNVAQVPQLWRLPSADALLAALIEGTVRTGGLLRAQSPEAFQAIRSFVCEASKAYEKDGAIEVPMPAVLASAKRA